jgi:MFS family permease
VLETFVGLGMSFGPAIGGFLFDWGGYGLPFYSLGVLMLLTIPLNLFLLPSNDEDGMDPEPSESMWKLVRVPPIFVLSLVIIVASNTWSFLDPTLEPHLREVS